MAEKLIGKTLDRMNADGKRFHLDAFASAVIEANNQVLMRPMGFRTTEIALTIARCTLSSVFLTRYSPRRFDVIKVCNQVCLKRHDENVVTLTLNAP